MVNGQTEPIKLFVGQVPRNWEAEQLRPVFEPYGEIQDLSILKDRVTGQHKGWKQFVNDCHNFTKYVQ